jgi:hypothetical protein
MSTRTLPGGTERPVRKADNHTAICEPTVYKCVSLEFSQTYGARRPVTGIALPFFFTFVSVLCYISALSPLLS